VSAKKLIFGHVRMTLLKLTGGVTLPAWTVGKDSHEAHTTEARQTT
jgi:hypothetical protein